MAQATCQLVAACLRPGAGMAEQARTQLDGLLLARARRHIDACIVPATSRLPRQRKA